MGKMFLKHHSKRENPISLIPYLSSAAQNDFIYSTSKSNISLGGDAKIPIGNALNWT